MLVGSWLTQNRRWENTSCDRVERNNDSQPEAQRVVLAPREDAAGIEVRTQTEMLSLPTNIGRQTEAIIRFARSKCLNFV